MFFTNSLPFFSRQSIIRTELNPSECDKHVQEMPACLRTSVVKKWQRSVAALSSMFKFYIIHHLSEQTDTTFLQTFRLGKKKWLKSEMPGEVTDWSSPLFVHPRWGEAAFELSSYRSTTEKPWVGAPISIRATPQHCCSRWKCLTYRIIILISVLLSRDSEISDLGRNIFLLFSGWRWCFSNFGVNLLWYLYITLEDRSQFTISVHLKVCFLQLQINPRVDGW